MNIIKKATVFILILALLLPAGVSGHLDEPNPPPERVTDFVELNEVILLSDVSDWWDVLVPVHPVTEIAIIITLMHLGHPPVVTKEFKGTNWWIPELPRPGLVSLNPEYLPPDGRPPLLRGHEECWPPVDFIATAFLFEYDVNAAVPTAFNIASAAALAATSLATEGGIVGASIAALLGVTAATGGAIAVAGIAALGIARQLIINQMDILDLGSGTVTFNPSSDTRPVIRTKGEIQGSGAVVQLLTGFNEFKDVRCSKKRPHPELPPTKQPTTPTPTPPPSITPTPAPVPTPTRPVTVPQVPALKVPVPESLVPKALKITHYANEKLEGIKEGDKVAFGVKMVMSDGSERLMVKGKVAWQVVGLIGSITSDGLFTAKLDESIAESGEGLGSIVATYQDASGTSLLGKTPIFKVEAYYGEPTGPQEGKLPGENFFGLLLKNLRFWK